MDGAARFNRRGALSPVAGNLRRRCALATVARMDAVSTLAGRMHRGVEDARAQVPLRPTGAAPGPGADAPTSSAVWPSDEPSGELAAAALAPELELAHRGLRVRRHRSLLLHWLGRWFRRPRPVVPDALAPVRDGEVAITFVGHASVLLRYRGLTVALDPMLGRWIGGVRRAVEPGLPASAFAEVDLILLSHRHLDHLHPQTLAAMPRRATVVVPPGAAAVVSPMGFARVVELQPGTEIELRGLSLTTFPLVHGAGELASGLAYLLRGRGPSVFFCADSAYHRGFAEIGQAYAPDIALLPIGGFWPSSFRRRHMSPLDALVAFRDLTARALVPIHHGAFTLSYERLGEPLRLLLEAATERGLRDYVLAMEPGQTDAFALEPCRVNPAWIVASPAPNPP